MQLLGHNLYSGRVTTAFLRTQQEIVMCLLCFGTNCPNSSELRFTLSASAWRYLIVLVCFSFQAALGAL